MPKSTRQCLAKTDHQRLYRHEKNKVYYGITKRGGKRKEHSLDTTDRKLAERRLKDWLDELENLDSKAGRMVLSDLLTKYELQLAGKAEKTRRTRTSILNRFRETWKHGLKLRVSEVKPSLLNEWLPNMKAG
jgi:hypothetical protein